MTIKLVPVQNPVAQHYLMCLIVTFSSQGRVRMTSPLQDMVLKPIDTTWALQYGKVISYILMLLPFTAKSHLCLHENVCRYRFMYVFGQFKENIQLYFAQIWPFKTVPCSKVCLAAVTKSVLLEITLPQDVALWVRMHTSCNLAIQCFGNLELGAWN